MDTTDNQPQEFIVDSQLPSPTPYIDLDEPKLPPFPSSQNPPPSKHVWFDCDCDACLAEAFDIAYDIEPDNSSRKKSSQQLLKERFENGDPAVGLLGESSGKYDYYVLYPRNQPIFQSEGLASSDQLFADIPSFDSELMIDADPSLCTTPNIVVNIETSENSVRLKTTVPPARISPVSKTIAKGRRRSRKRRSISRITRPGPSVYSPSQSLSSPTSLSMDLPIPVDWDREEDSFRQRLSRFEIFGRIDGLRVLILISNTARENYVTRSVVTKLRRKTFLTEPPKIASVPLSENQHLPLTRDCIFNLDIGIPVNNCQDSSYNDLISAVVGPLDTYDVILGRAWLYDNDVMYNGRRNTMSFWTGFRNITLYPLEPP